MINDIEKWGEGDLVKRIGEVVTGATSGLEAQQAQAELARRQIVATIAQTAEMKKSGEITQKYNYIILGLTFVMLFVGIEQVLMAISLSNKSRADQIFLSIFVIASTLAVAIYAIRGWKKLEKK